MVKKKHTAEKELFHFCVLKTLNLKTRKTILQTLLKLSHNVRFLFAKLDRHDPRILFRDLLFFSLPWLYVKFLRSLKIIC